MKRSKIVSACDRRSVSQSLGNARSSDVSAWILLVERQTVLVIDLRCVGAYGGSTCAPPPPQTAPVPFSRLSVE